MLRLMWGPHGLFQSSGTEKLEHLSSIDSSGEQSVHWIVEEVAFFLSNPGAAAIEVVNSAVAIDISWKVFEMGVILIEISKYCSVCKYEYMILKWLSVFSYRY